MFEAAAKLGRADWIGWLQRVKRDFIDAVGDLAIGEYRVIIAGGIEANAGFVFASGSATVRASDSATVEAYGSATVEAYGSATVEAYGSATVEASDSATILIVYWAIHVKVEIKSDQACAVDRRPDGKPKLILMDQGGEVLAERELATTAE